MSPVSPTDTHTLCTANTHQSSDIKTVGHERFGFDSQVETDVLRSLYLVSRCAIHHKDSAYIQAPSYIKSGSKTVNIGSEKKDFGSESVYDKESNSIQYTTVAKFPPVKLLPNSERKRILSELRLTREMEINLFSRFLKNKVRADYSHWWCRFRWISLG